MGGYGKIWWLHGGAVVQVGMGWMAAAGRCELSAPFGVEFRGKAGQGDVSLFPHNKDTPLSALTLSLFVWMSSNKNDLVGPVRLPVGCLCWHIQSPGLQMVAVLSREVSLAASVCRGLLS